MERTEIKGSLIPDALHWRPGNKLGRKLRNYKICSGGDKGLLEP